MPDFFRTKHSKARTDVFVSYARSDGAEFAGELRTRLEAEGIPLWQDSEEMEGGRDWWLQITKALDRVEFMVLVMTPAALGSKTVRDEWRYARQQGVCVYPVKAAPDIDFATLPRWMRDVHFYNIEREWNKFLNDLKTRCQTPRVPFMAEEPEGFVGRSSELDQLASYLLDHEREEPIAITAALRGAGGYGKTTLAQALCHREDIRNAFDDGVLWVTLGEDPGDLTGRVEDLIYMLSGERPGFTAREAAVARLVELLANRDILIVIDDVWNAAHLKPFLQGGERCARLITTRNHDTLPPAARKLDVDAMLLNEAVTLLSAGLPAGSEGELRELAARLGEWPLLLKLANGILGHRVRDTGQALPEAIVYANQDLDENGLVAFDADASDERERAVASTLRVSLRLLTEQQRVCYDQLAIFPEDVDIPLATIEKLWRHPAGLSRLKTETLCDRLTRLSLLLRFDLRTRQIRLHDVFRKYLIQELGDLLPTTHRQFLDAHRLPPAIPASLPASAKPSDDWADLPVTEPYLWKHLAYHLVEAQLGEELVDTVKDLRYLVKKTWVSKVPAAEADLMVAEKQTASDTELRLLRRSYVQSGHILNRCSSVEDVEATLYARLGHLVELAFLNRKLQQELTLPYLEPWHLLPDLPDSALERTLASHSSWVAHCALSADDSFIVSASWDNTLKVWDARSGTQRFTLPGHTRRVKHCAISADGSFIVSCSDDQTLRVWDVCSGTKRFILAGHRGRVNHCAISADGSFIVSASDDETLKVWDAVSGTERFPLAGHAYGVGHCAISADGSFIVSASDDETLKVWDAVSGTERFPLAGHTRKVTHCAISADGSFIVSASLDQTLKVWDAHRGKERFPLTGHTGWVNHCAISADGSFIVSASVDQTLKVWDAYRDKERFTLAGHNGSVKHCAISADGSFIVSASWDRTLKVWGSASGKQRFTLAGHTGLVNHCAISADGSFIVSASEDLTLKVWDAGGNIERLPLADNTDPKPRAMSAAHGSFVISASGDKTPKEGDAGRSTERFPLAGHTRRVSHCAISADGSFIVSASWDKTLKVWDAASGTERFPLPGHTGSVNHCAISADGSFIVSASLDQTLKVWDACTGNVRFTLPDHASFVNHCAISPDGSFIVSASEDNTLKVWDARTGNERFPLARHAGRVKHCAISADGSFIVSCSDDRTLRVWDAGSGNERFPLARHTGLVNHCAISADDSFIVSASGDNTLKVWNARTGNERFPLADHIEAVNHCAISADGSFIVSASDDRTLKVWNVESASLRFSLAGHTDAVNHCAISANGSFIVSASGDQTVKVWEAHTGTLVSTFYTDNPLEGCAWFPDHEHILAFGGAAVYFLRLVK